MTLASKALPPVGWYMDIHRGDRVRSVTALHSAYVQNALLSTEGGRTIALSQNTSSRVPTKGWCAFRARKVCIRQ